MTAQEAALPHKTDASFCVHITLIACLPLENVATCYINISLDHKFIITFIYHGVTNYFLAQDIEMNTVIQRNSHIVKGLTEYVHFLHFLKFSFKINPCQR